MEVSLAKLRKTVEVSPIHQQYMEKMKKDFEFFQQNPIPVITYHQFRRIYDDGNRHEYERNMYFRRRERLSKCALLYMVYGEQKYLDMLEDVIWTICDEYTWSLPAHIWGKDLENVAGYRYLIDLFAAETGFAMSEIYHLIGDKFSDMLRQRVEHEVKERIIDAFLNREGGFPFETKVNNWSAVCAGSVGAAFIYMATREQFDAAYPRLKSAIDHFLRSYGDDGCCEEGLGYWEYGFGFYTYFGELLRRYTSGKIDYFADKKIENMANFQSMAILRDNKTISFSDGFESMTFHQGLATFLASEFDSVTVPDAKYAKTPDDDHCFRWCAMVRDFMWYNADVRRSGNQEKHIFKEDAHWYIKTTKDYAFAAKGGHNAEPHNHNDIGHFLFISGDEIAFADLGSGEYTREYFGAGRYDIVNNASFGHSIPEINGAHQLPGGEYHGQVLSQDENHFNLELKDAYPDCGLESFVRCFDFNDKGFTLTDTFEGDVKDVKERFVTKIAPEVYGSEVKVGNTKLVLENAQEIVVTSMDFKDHSAKEQTVYFIDAEVKGNTFKAEIIG